MQGKGVGDHLSYALPTADTAVEHMQRDNFQLQSEIDKTMKSEIMQPKQDDEGTLEIARSAAQSTEEEVTNREDALDEIYIDLRGEMHHKSQQS